MACTPSGGEDGKSDMPDLFLRQRISWIKRQIGKRQGYDVSDRVKPVSDSCKYGNHQ